VPRSACPAAGAEDGAASRHGHSSDAAPGPAAHGKIPTGTGSAYCGYFDIGANELTGPNRLKEAARNSRSIVLTSHPAAGGASLPVRWGEADPVLRGPVVATLNNPGGRNAIGAHSGQYSVYRALAVAAGRLSPDHRPDLSDTAPAMKIGPFPQWADPARIVSLDPWGHVATEAFAAPAALGWDIRPTIAVTRARLNMPEIGDALRAGRLVADGDILTAGGDARVTKIAIEPV